MNTRNIKGLTLAELLISAAILVFVFCGLLGLFLNCMFLNRTNRNRFQATMHAQYILEEIRDASFFNLQQRINNGEWSWNTPAAWRIHCININMDPLSDETVVTSVRPGSPNDPLEVQVRVDWVDSQARSMSLQLQTKFTDY